MPNNYATLESLKRPAKQHGFRPQAHGESESAYRAALAAHVQPIDPVEAIEIRSGLGWDQHSPVGMLSILTAQAAPV